MTYPSVSVIIPVYERPILIRDAIESVFRQTLPPAEILIIDDGSRDGTADSIRPYIPRVRHISVTENTGVSAARNAGAAAAKGAILAFLDSDDLFMPSKLERQLPLMKSFRVSHTDEHWIRKGRFVNQGKAHAKYGGAIFDKILDKCRISPSSLMLEKAFFEELGGYNEALRVCEDYEFSIRMALKGEIAYLPEKLIIKRAVAANSLSAGIAHIESLRLDILKDLLACIPEGELRQSAQREILRKKEIVKRL